MKISLRELARLMDAEVIGNGDVEITGVAGIKEARPGDITFLANPKYEAWLRTTKAAAVIMERNSIDIDKPVVVNSNPYYAFSAILMAGIDGIQNKIDPGDPLDRNIYDLPPEEMAKVPLVPGSLEGALQALADDHEFLLKGDVFTADVVDTWIEYKTDSEVKPLSLRPHPYEFMMYYDI